MFVLPPVYVSEPVTFPHLCLAKLTYTNDKQGNVRCELTYLWHCGYYRKCRQLAFLTDIMLHKTSENVKQLLT